MNASSAQRGLLLLPAAGALLLLILRPEAASAAAAEGIDSCLRSLLPALFPFLVMTNVILGLGVPRRLLRLLGRPFEAVFHIRRTALSAFLTGLAGGCPVGAYASVACFRRGDCSREEAERLLIFANNCSPGFLIGVIGPRILQDGAGAIRLLIMQWLVSVYIGYLLGIGRTPSRSVGPAGGEKRPSPAQLLTAAVREGGRSGLVISAYVVFFRVFTAFLPPRPLLRGLLELTSGLSLITGRGLPQTLTAAFLLGWGGLSVACQVISAAEGTELRTGTYIPLRLFHGALMVLCCWSQHKGGPFLLLPLLIFAVFAFLVKTCRKERKHAI